MSRGRTSAPLPTRAELVEQKGRCKACGRTLRSAESVALGYGVACARRLGLYATARQRRERRAAILGTGADRLLFPDDDRPLVDQAANEEDEK